MTEAHLKAPWPGWGFPSFLVRVQVKSLGDHSWSVSGPTTELRCHCLHSTTPDCPALVATKGTRPAADPDNSLG